MIVSQQVSRKNEDCVKLLGFRPAGPGVSCKLPIVTEYLLYVGDLVPALAIEGQVWMRRVGYFGALNN